MTTQADTAATLRGALATALSAPWAALGFNAADTSQNLKEVVESAVWPESATSADCDAMVTAFIAKVTAESAGKTVVVLSAPHSDVFVMGDKFSAYVTVLLGFLET
jgi:hypothetical protein